MSARRPRAPDDDILTAIAALGPGFSAAFAEIDWHLSCSLFGNASNTQSDARECPVVSELVAAHILNSQTRTRDAWDNEFIIECDPFEVIVHSAGPDGELGTEDDL